MGKAVTNLGLKATMNDDALSTVGSVTYLGVTFSSNAKWTTHVEESLRLSFFVKKIF